MHISNTKTNLQAAITANIDVGNRITLGDCLKDKPNKSVWDCALDGEEVILKYYSGLGAFSQVEKESFLVQNIADILGSDTPARGPKLLLSRPDLGFYCLEKCPGISGESLLMPDEDPWPFLVSRAAMWLGVLVEKTSKTNMISSNYWRDVMSEPPHFELVNDTAQQLYDAILQKALIHLQGAAGLVTKSVIHGDFHLGNLLISQDFVYGIDFQAKNIGIVVRDVAYFLIRTNAKCQTAGTVFGFNESVIAPFRSILPEGELDRLLPVFLGVELLKSFKNDRRWTPRTVQRRNDLAQRYITC
jgi:hypothetical protein